MTMPKMGSSVSKGSSFQADSTEPERGRRMNFARWALDFADCNVPTFWLML